MKETRIYLNTVEDITKSLSEGRTVYCEIDDAGYKARIKMINGILVQKQYDNDIYINAGDWIFKENAYYLKAKEPLKIEVGKFYKTRNGEKVICTFKDENDKEGMPFYFSVIGASQRFWTTEKGIYYDGKNKIRDERYDIVDYWEDK